MAETQNKAGVQAAFLCNQKGEVCIAFDDPAYVCSDIILIDLDGQSIHVVLHESECLIGHISPAMAQAFRRRDTALLTALRPDGSIFEMIAPISASIARKEATGHA